MEQRVIILNKDKERLAGILLDPGSETVIILCHGFLLNKNSIFFPDLCKELYKNNLATFRFDFAGNGESEGKFTQDSILKEVRDLETVIRHFSKGFRNLGLIAHSKGGSVAILAAAKNKQIKFLITIAAVCYPFQHFLTKLTDEERKVLKELGLVSLQRILGKEIPLTNEMIQGIESLDITKAASDVSVPALILHAENDLLVPVPEANDIASRIKNAKVTFFKDAGHFFNRKKSKNELITTILKWLQESSFGASSLKKSTGKP